MSDALLYWGLGLLVLALGLIILEVLVPSAGAISVVAFVLSLVGLVCLFRHDWRWGLSGLLVMLVLGPAAFFFGLQIFPSTPIGRRIINATPIEEQQRPDDGLYAELINREGQAATDLRPAGFVRIDGRRVAAISEVSFIASGTAVRVTSADGMQVRVRPVA